MIALDYNLTEYEKDVLRASVNAPTKGWVGWGAAMSVAMETLNYAGLTDKFGKITTKGEHCLREMGDIL